MKNKYLILVQNKEEINDLREQNINYVLPLKSFSIGFPNDFSINEIQENSFILANILFDNSKINEFKKLLPSLKIKGIIFTDVGLIEILKPYKFEKIFFANHLMTNFQSINEMLKYVDTVLLSTDITNNECEEILNLSSKKLTLYGLGLVNIMNSKRHLVSNYNEIHNLERKNVLNISNSNIELLLIENNEGTVIYKNNFLNNLTLGLNTNIKYIFINSINIPFNNIIELINTDNFSLPFEDGFANKKTIYKIKGGE
jgi:collagenase-like PrtC family protease